MAIPNYEDAIHSRLSGDSALLAILTGGVLKYSALGKFDGGFNSLPASVKDTAGFLKPFALVKARALITTGHVVAREIQYSTIEQTLEVWVYGESHQSANTFENAANRIYSLLQFKPPTGAFDMQYITFIDLMRDPDMGNARFTRHDYLIVGRIT